MRPIAVLAASFIVSLWAVTGLSEDAPPVAFEDFGFSVADARVVKKIDGAMGNELSASTGHQLVIVVVSGQAPGAGPLELDPNEFLAMYSSAGESVTNAAKAVSPGNVWLFTETMGYAMTSNIEQAGPFQFEVAVSVPEDVSEFDLYRLEASLGRVTLNP